MTAGSAPDEPAGPHGLAATVAPGLDAPDGLVDVHVHCGASDTGELYYPELTTDAYLRLAQAAGVARAAVFAPYRDSGYAQVNGSLRDAAAAGDGRLVAFARLGGRRLPLPVRPPQPWQVRRALRSRVGRRQSDLPAGLDGFGGVKLLPHLDGVPPDAELEAVAAARLPVVVHCGEHCPPAWVERALLPRLRGCTVVLAHLGVFPLAVGLLDDAVAVVRRHPDVVLETSGVWSADLVARAVRALPDGVAFGSDAPLASPAVAWRHVAASVRDDALLARVAQTSARVLA